MKPFAVLMLFLLLGGMGCPVEAQLVDLDEDEMAEVTGGYGFAIPAGEALRMIMSMETMFYHDEDGTGDLTPGAFLSFCGVHLDGSISTGYGVKMTFGDMTSMIDGSRGSGISYDIDDMVIKIDTFSVDAIRVGGLPGAGMSFGAFGIHNYVMQLSGQVQIYTH